MSFFLQGPFFPLHSKNILFLPSMLLFSTLLGISELGAVIGFPIHFFCLARVTQPRLQSFPFFCSVQGSSLFSLPPKGEKRLIVTQIGDFGSLLYARAPVIFC